MLDCMDLQGNCCPHYDEEAARKPALSRFIKDKMISDCYAIDGGCALHIKMMKHIQQSHLKAIKTLIL